jgi:beta-lactamase class A
MDQGELISINPDIAFTASSTVKIPIMVSYFIKHGTDGLNEQSTALITDMMRKSENPPADRLMESLDALRGPLVVTEDMRKIGLENTFLAGYFYQGAALLRVFDTPSNQRTDVVTEPDLYSQTTPTEIGELLRDIYFCAQTGGGNLVAAFPGQITQQECQVMIQLLKNDRTPWLIPAGVPDGTEVAQSTVGCRSLRHHSRYERRQLSIRKDLCPYFLITRFIV